MDFSRTTEGKCAQCPDVGLPSYLAKFEMASHVPDMRFTKTLWDVLLVLGMNQATVQKTP